MLPLPSLLVVPPEVMLCVGECTAGGRTGGAEEERWSTEVGRGEGERARPRVCAKLFAKSTLRTRGFDSGQAAQTSSAQG